MDVSLPSHEGLSQRFFNAHLVLVQVVGPPIATLLEEFSQEDAVEKFLFTLQLMLSSF